MATTLYRPVGLDELALIWDSGVPSTVPPKVWLTWRPDSSENCSLALCPRGSIWRARMPSSLRS